MSLEYIIERAVDNVLERLARSDVASPAFAVALFSHDPETLFAANITIGLERDRQAALPGLIAGPGPFAIWNAYEFGAAAPHPPQLDDDPKFVRAQEAVLADLYAQDIIPGPFVLNRVAARLGTSRPAFPVTEDFIAYAYAEDVYQLVENLRFSASPKSLALLEAKGLIFDVPDDGLC